MRHLQLHACLATLSCCLFFVAPALAQNSTNNCAPYAPNNLDNNSVVGTVTINANDIFDLSSPGESSRIYQLGNQLHKQTHRKVIKQQLLFKPGDVFDGNTLAESERLLRKNDYLQSATVTATTQCGNAINVDVVTRDHWSLLPKFSFTREGGENSFVFSVTESNLLGLGKTLAFAYQKDSLRDQTILEYKDKNVAGSRRALALQLQDNSDGKRQFVNYGLPFYSLSAPNSWQVTFDHSQFLTRLYEDPAAPLAFDYSNDLIDINIGKLKESRSDAVQRYWLGVRLDDTTTIDISDSNAPVNLPQRRYIYPYIQWQWQQQTFAEQTNLLRMNQVEDVALGHFFESRIGFASEAFDSSENAALLSALYRKGWKKNNTLGFFNTKFSTVKTSSDLNNTVVKPQLKLYWFQSDKRTLLLSASAAIGSSLYPENQFVVGGNNGLRGYDLQAQGGNTRLVLSAEQRWYPDWYPWRLFKVGAAAFFDAGSAWDRDVYETPDWLTNVGLGMRVLSTRQSNAPVTHIDIAMPLNGSKDLQLIIKSKATF